MSCRDGLHRISCWWIFFVARWLDLSNYEVHDRVLLFLLPCHLVSASFILRNRYLIWLLNVWEGVKGNGLLAFITVDRTQDLIKNGPWLTLCTFPQITLSPCRIGLSHEWKVIISVLRIISSGGPHKLRTRTGETLQIRCLNIEFSGVKIWAESSEDMP